MSNETITDSKQTIMIDASSLKHISCFRKFYRMVVKGYKAKDVYRGDYKMAYGSAIHKFLEGYYACKPIKDCVQLAIDYYKPFNDTVKYSAREFRFNNNLIKTCEAYQKAFPRISFDDNTIKISDNDFQPHSDIKDKQTIEYKFAITIYENEKYRLVLTGTVDLVCSYAGIEILLVDHKSTATSAEYSDDFFSAYALDIQTMLYSKVYKEALKLDYYPMILINGIFVSKPTDKAAKNNIFDGVEFKRSSPISYSNGQMEQFNMWFNEKIAEIKLYMENNFEDVENIFNLSFCKHGTYNCQFFDVCKLPIKFHQAALDNNFITKTYNPLEFR